MSGEKFIIRGGNGEIYETSYLDNVHYKKCIAYDKNDTKSTHNLRIEKFRREIKIMNGLRHRHIVQFFGEREDQDKMIIEFLMELCIYGSLDKIILCENYIYTMHTVVWWTTHLFDALAYLHNNNILHKDVKTNNVFVANEYLLKLGDFGDAEYCKTGHIKSRGEGNFLYWAPEVLEEKFTLKSDVYSLALILWEILERRPVDRDNRLEPLPTPIAPKEIQDMFLKCTNEKDEERPLAGEVLAFFQEEKKKHKASLPLLEAKPWKDEGQKKLLRPVGYDGTRAYVGIMDHLDLGDLGIDIFDENKKAEPIKPENLIKALTRVDYHPSDFARIEFEKQLNGLSNQERKDFYSTVEDFIIKKRNERYVFDFAEAPNPPNPDALRVFNASEETDTIKLWFANILEADLNDQFFKYRLAFEVFEEIFKTAFCSWDLLELIKVRIDWLDKLDEFSYHKRIYFKKYFWTSKKNEWLLLTKSYKALFIKLDLSEVHSFYGDWEEDDLYVKERIEDYLDEDNKMEFKSEEPLDLNYLKGHLIKASQKLEKAAKNYMDSLVPYHFKLNSNGQGPDLPIPGYIFQIKNPPRAICECESKEPIKSCPLEGGFPLEALENGQLVYYRCTNQNLVDYIELYTKFCKELTLLQRRGLKAREYTGIFQYGIHFSEVLSKNSCPKYFMFFLHKTKDKEVILLDHPENYRMSKPMIPCLDQDFNFGKIPLQSSDIQKDRLVKIDVRELMNLYSKDPSKTYQFFNKVQRDILPNYDY